MSSGEVVRVIATDPAAHLDFGRFCLSNQVILYLRWLNLETSRFFIFRKNKFLSVGLGALTEADNRPFLLLCSVSQLIVRINSNRIIDGV